MSDSGTGSKLFPKTYKGKEDSGGYLAENKHPTSRNSPQWRGRLYLTGIGWYWLSGWVREGKEGELVSISARGMTDQEATQYCQTNARSSKKAAAQEESESPASDDIPF